MDDTFTLPKLVHCRIPFSARIVLQIKRVSHGFQGINLVRLEGYHDLSLSRYLFCCLPHSPAVSLLFDLKERRTEVEVHKAHLPLGVVQRAYLLLLTLSHK